MDKNIFLFFFKDFFPVGADAKILCKFHRKGSCCHSVQREISMKVSPRGNRLNLPVICGTSR
jgi:hypothetical protein